MSIEMTDAEAAEFLAGMHVGILAIEHPGRGPLALPIWYLYEPGGDVIVSTSGDSLKARLLRAAGRATITVQDESPPYKYVSVEGPVRVGAEALDGLALASRYLGPELGKWYAERNPPSDESVVVRLTPSTWRSTDYGKGLPADAPDA